MFANLSHRAKTLTAEKKAYWRDIDRKRAEDALRAELQMIYDRIEDKLTSEMPCESVFINKILSQSAIKELKKHFTVRKHYNYAEDYRGSTVIVNNHRSGCFKVKTRVHDGYTIEWSRKRFE